MQEIISMTDNATPKTGYLNIADSQSIHTMIPSYTKTGLVQYLNINIQKSRYLFIIFILTNSNMHLSILKSYELQL